MVGEPVVGLILKRQAKVFKNKYKKVKKKGECGGGMLKDEGVCTEEWG